MSFTANNKHSRHNRENFPQPVQMHLFTKPKRFYESFYISEHPSEINVLAGPKHYWYMYGSTFIVSFIQFEIDLVRKLIS